VKEPEGGAHTDLEAAAQFLDEVLDRQLTELTTESVKDLVAARYKKFRQMGNFSIFRRNRCVAAGLARRMKFT